jgi:hypothetical protein
MTLTTIVPHMQTRNWKDWERESWLEHEAMNGILDANNLFFVSHIEACIVQFSRI